MLRTLGCTALALVFCVVALNAKEYKNVKVKKIDTDKKTITVTIDDKDQTFTYNDKTTFLRGKEKEIKQEALTKMAERINEKGGKASFVTVEKDGKEVKEGGKLLLEKVTFGGKKGKSQ
jgi:hypothetical protein